VNHIDLVEDDVSLGRHKRCTVVLNDQRVSGRHCRLFRTPDSTSRVGTGAAAAAHQHNGNSSSSSSSSTAAAAGTTSTAAPTAGSHLFFVEDLSSNGTFRNEKKVRREHRAPSTANPMSTLSALS